MRAPETASPLPLEHARPLALAMARARARLAATGRMDPLLVAQYGPRRVPLGQVPPALARFLRLTDPRVYGSPVYVVWHHFQHHAEEAAEALARLPDVLGDPDDMVEGGRSGGYVLRRSTGEGGYDALAVRLTLEADRLVYRTFFSSPGLPYPRREPLWRKGSSLGWAETPP